MQLFDIQAVQPDPQVTDFATDNKGDRSIPVRRVTLVEPEDIVPAVKIQIVDAVLGHSVQAFLIGDIRKIRQFYGGAFHLAHLINGRTNADSQGRARQSKDYFPLPHGLSPGVGALRLPDIGEEELLPQIPFPVLRLPQLDGPGAVCTAGRG